MEEAAKGIEETSPRGNDWEVVSLTASAYAAAPTPGPKKFEVIDVENARELPAGEQITDSSMLTSDFVFPPSQHENLPLVTDEVFSIKDQVNMTSGDEELEPDTPQNAEMQKENEGTEIQGIAPGKRDSSEELAENLNLGTTRTSFKSFKESEPLHEIPFFDEKGKNISFHGKGFEEVGKMEGLHWIEPIQHVNVDEEQSIFSSTKLGSFYAEADKSGMATDSSMADAELMKVSPEFEESSDEKSDTTSDSLNSLKIISNEYKIPCEAWWKRHAMALYSHAKEANAFWSVFVAAAVMGLVILGHRWQQEKWQIQHMRSHLSISDERLSRILGPVTKFKDALVGHRQGPVLRGSSVE